LYLVLTIFYKWIIWPTDQSCCAPSLLINLINIFMMTNAVECVGQAKAIQGTPTYLYAGQNTVQRILLGCALIAVPWLLIYKPYVLYKRNKARSNRNSQAFGNIRIESNANPNEAIIDHDELSEVNSNVELNFDAEFEPVPEFNMQETAIYQIIHTIEFCLACISHTASYLRLWALSLAHAELSEVLWNMMLSMGLKVGGSMGVIMKWIFFIGFSCITIGILICMEGLSAFLHALRLHWVEFNSKFFKGEGYAFMPFCFEAILEAPENVL